jgi:hypothetical protein
VTERVELPKLELSFFFWVAGRKWVGLSRKDYQNVGAASKRESSLGG